MKNGKSISILVILILSIIIIFYVIDKETITESNTTVFNIPPQIDTVEVIIEYDGDREIRWYTIDTTWNTIDTIKYEYIDTTIINWPWGREEFYYFKYKTDTIKNKIIN